MPNKLLKVAVMLVAVAGTGWAHSQIPPTTRVDMGQDFVPNPTIARTTTLGFDALLADYYWLQALQIVGGNTTVDAEIAGHLGKIVDVVTTLNPHVGHPYRFAAVWLNHDEPQVREGNRLLRRAIENHPEDWRNPYYLGFNHFFYLYEHEEAAKELEVALDLPGSPSYLGRLVARLKSQHADIDVAEVFLRELLERTTDTTAAAKLEGALDEIEIEYKARYLDQARAAYQELAGRDIEDVADLITEPHRMMSDLPDPEPKSLPDSLRRGSSWEIDEKTNRIVSSYLGKRYEVHYTGVDQQRLKSWGKGKGEGASSRSREEGVNDAG